MTAAIVALLARRAPGASICPSEAARAICAGADGWRDAMPAARHASQTLAEAGIVLITQGEHAIAPADLASTRGPIRLRRGPAFPSQP